MYTTVRVKFCSPGPPVADNPQHDQPLEDFESIYVTKEEAFEDLPTWKHPLITSPSGVPVFLSPACVPASASLPPWGGAAVLSTGVWVRGCVSATAYPLSPVSYSSSPPPSPEPSYDPLYMQLPSSYPPPPPLPSTSRTLLPGLFPIH